MEKLDMLELRNVSKAYQGVEILKDVNFKIEKGTTNAIVGASGSGKTTLFNIVSLMDVPTSGEVLYFNKNVQQAEYTAFRKKYIGFVYQQHNLMPELSLFENIAIVAKLKGCYNKEEIDTLLKSVGLLEHKNKKPAELSGGQKQRGAIVRAIASKPEILFADEPTGNLDPTSAQTAANLLLNLAKSHNIAIMLITHNMEIAKKCQNVYEVKNKNLIKI